MGAEVGSVVPILRGYNEDDLSGEKSKGLITRDFLGCGFASDFNSTELDLDMEVPNGWEKRLDLKSGKVYLQRSKSPVATSSSDTKDRSTTKTSSSTVQDLNFPPFSSKKQPLTFIEDACLDLKLVPPANNYQSVCTLDKVKSALERAEIKSSRKRSSNSSSSSSHSTSSMKETDEEDEEKSSLPSPAGLLFAAGCPHCLLYVLISRNNPKCPRCDTVVASPLSMMKKPRIDLNLAV